ncbi:MAG TPA: hypothetical protein VIU43_05485 [Nitrosospira sp.]
MPQSEIDVLNDALSFEKENSANLLADIKRVEAQRDALKADVERLRRERDLLGAAIRNAATKAGIVSADASLTGPMLIMLCDDLANAANQ